MTIPPPQTQNLVRETPNQGEGAPPLTPAPAQGEVLLELLHGVGQRVAAHGQQLPLLEVRVALHARLARPLARLRQQLVVRRGPGRGVLCRVLGERGGQVGGVRWGRRCFLHLITEFFAFHTV